MNAALMNGETLKFLNSSIFGTDLIDLVLLGRKVPVFSSGEITGEASINGNLIHISGKDRCVISRKCLRGLLDGRVLSIRCQPVPDGVTL